MSQTRPWLQHYPSGISTEIDTDAFRTIADVFNTSVIKYRHCPAYTNFGKTLTYGEVDLLTKQFASYLLNVLKLKKSDRIALMMLNCLQYPVATFGALCAGLAVVNVNPSTQRANSSTNWLTQGALYWWSWTTSVQLCSTSLLTPQSNR